MRRAAALQALALRSGARAQVPNAIRFDCKDGKCGHCHACTNTKRVAVMLRDRRHQ